MLTNLNTFPSNHIKSYKILASISTVASKLAKSIKYAETQYWSLTTYSLRQKINKFMFIPVAFLTECGWSPARDLLQTFHLHMPCALEVQHFIVPPWKPNPLNSSRPVTTLHCPLQEFLSMTEFKVKPHYFDETSI